MKYLNTVSLSVFAKPAEGEDVAAIREALIALVPLNLAEQKIAVKDEAAQGFNEKKIHILSITLTKTAHCNAFLKEMLNRLTTEQKELLASQKDSRLDNEFNFFIRLDKDRWLNRDLSLTDSGRCFHVKLNLAVFPARRPDALALVEKIFKPE